jgi:hypothetical protein
MKFWKSIVLAVGSLALGQLAGFAAMVVVDYDADLHDRFNNSGSFIGADFDWSGVGQTDSGRWVTMISDQYFVSATHYTPANGQTVRFYHSNDGAGGFEDLIVDDTFGMPLMTAQGVSDIWIGRLTGPISNAVTFYDIFDVGGAPESLEGVSIWNVGASGGTTFASFRVGTNVYDLTPLVNPYDLGVDERSVSVVNGWSATLTYNEASPNDTYYQGGDSGAPSFVVVDGVLQLVGVHSATADAPPVGLSDGDFSLDSLLSPYREEITALLTPVPEPGSLALILVAGMALWRRCR